MLVQLNDRQHRMLAQVLGGSKLAPLWSLPMRCMSVSKNLQAGIFRCAATGLQMEAHVSRVRELPDPVSKRLAYENEAVIRAETAFMSLLARGDRGRGLGDLGDRMVVLRPPHLCWGRER